MALSKAIYLYIITIMSRLPSKVIPREVGPDSCPLSLACLERPETLTSIRINGSIESGSVSKAPGNVTDQYQCHNLQEALELVNTLSKGTMNDCRRFEIILETTVHLITRPVLTSAAVHIAGISEEVSKVQCSHFNETARKLKNEPEESVHILYFNRSKSVVFSNVEFVGCPLPIRIDWSDCVRMVQSSFRFFRESVLEIHNSIKVEVGNCTFISNHGTGIINEPFRGNPGALAITFSKVLSDSQVNVTDTTFTNNSAIPFENHLTPNQVFVSRIFTGRGGGLTILVHEDKFDVSVEIQNCSFQENSARSYGGGVYILFRGYGSHKALIEQVVFEGNTANEGGGGLTYIGTKGTVGIDHVHMLNIMNCSFRNNSATFGSGWYYSINLDGGKTNVANVLNTVFISNWLYNEKFGFGAAIAMDIADTFEEKESSPTNLIRNCQFLGNIGESSIVSIGHHRVQMSGRNTFINNTGPALRLVSSRTVVRGSLEFINNSAVDGAALFLLSYSQIRLAPNSTLLFNGNSGRFGASIFVSSVSAVDPFAKLSQNPLCFMVPETDALLSQSKWTKINTSVTFTNNSALLGSVLYTASLASCSWVANSVSNSFDKSYLSHSPFFDIRDGNRNTAFPDPYSHRFSIATDPVDLNETGMDQKIQGWPGQLLNISIKPIDELGNPTAAITRLSTFKNFPSGTTLQLKPNTILVSGKLINTELSYYFQNGVAHDTADQTQNLEMLLFGVQLLSRRSFVRLSHLSVEDCIGGYSLVSGYGSKGVCRCDRNNENIILCNEDDDSIIIKRGKWAVNVKGNGLFLHTCPPGYCRCFLDTNVDKTLCVNMFTNSDPNKQCACGRKGILCGECVSGTGVSVLLNLCTSCSSLNLLLIPLLVITITFVMMIIILIDLPLPAWSYPIIFYIQSATLASTRFPATFINASKPLAYIANGFGFYFPYDFCIHNELQSSHSCFLRFLPPLTATVIIPLTVLFKSIAKRYLKRCVNVSSFKGHGIWTIILLTCTNTLHTSTSVLHCPIIPYSENGSLHSVWYMNGSTECFHGKHIPLALLAIFFITLHTLLIPTIALFTYGKLKRFTYFEKFRASPVLPYKKHGWFWCSMELYRRLFIVVLVTSFQDHLNYILLFLMVLIFLFGYCNPYIGQTNNLLEIASLMMFLLLIMLRMNLPVEEALRETLDGQITIPSCSNDETTISSFSALLLTIYYIPVILGLISLFVCLMTLLISQLLKLKTKMQTANRCLPNFGVKMVEYKPIAIMPTSTELFDPGESDYTKLS